MTFEARRFPTRRQRSTGAPRPPGSSSSPKARAASILSVAAGALLVLPFAAGAQERPVQTIEPQPGGGSHVTSNEVITAVGLDPLATVVGFSGSADEGYDVIDTPVSGFPTEGSSFLVISSGLASSATNPDPSFFASVDLSALKTSEGEDLVSVSFTMAPPQGAQCLSFDFKFFSEEFPDYVGSAYSDTFLAETPESTFTITGNVVEAQNNVAFDAADGLITINTVFGMSLANASGTPYGGATTTLRTDHTFTVDGNGNVKFVFSIMDLGDSGFDSTAFLDNFRWGDEFCETITEPTATPTATPTPTASPAPTSPEEGLVQIYHSPADNGAPGCVPPCGNTISGGPGDQINLWIDGGSVPSGPGETVCRFGPLGGQGDNLCGADILIQLSGPGSLTGIEPTVDTLVCNPVCTGCDPQTGICPLPTSPKTTSIRMNFRRGPAFAPPAFPPVGPRRIATLFVDSSGASIQTPTQVFANGVEAVGANLQLREIANAVDSCTSAGEPFGCCTGGGTGNGQWPCGPRLIAAPEPGQLWQLLSGLAGLGYLHRRRRRA